MQRLQGAEDRLDERKQILNSAGTRGDDDNAEWKLAKVVLSLQLPVHRDERIDGATRALQEFAIEGARPAQALDGHDFVTHQLWDQVVRQVLVKQDAH